MGMKSMIRLRRLDFNEMIMGKEVQGEYKKIVARSYVVGLG